MSWFTSIRDAFEGVGSLVGNYFLPGSSIITAPLTSKGSQEFLGSSIGQLANLGSGIAGGAAGNLSNYGTAANSIMSNFGFGGGAGGGGVSLGMEQMGPAVSNNAIGVAQMSADVAGAGGAPQQQNPWQSWLSGLQKGGTNTAAGWFSPQTILQGLSGVSQMSQAASMRDLAKTAQQQSSPWATSGGMVGAGGALTNAISGDLSQDPGFLLSQQAAARASGGTPGGPATQAAANAAQQYRMQLIQMLGGPAGVGFSPGQGAATAVQAMGGANTATNQAFASFGAGANTATGTPGAMPPWLQAYLIKNGLGA